MTNRLTMSCHSKVSDVLSPCREDANKPQNAALLQAPTSSASVSRPSETESINASPPSAFSLQHCFTEWRCGGRRTFFCRRPDIGKSVLRALSPLGAIFTKGYFTGGSGVCSRGLRWGIGGRTGLHCRHGVGSGEFIRQNGDGYAAVPGSSLGGRIVGEGAIFTVTDGPDAVRVHGRLFGEEMKETNSKR